MALWTSAWIALAFSLAPAQAATRDAARTGFNAAMAAAVTEGLPALVARLDKIATEQPGSAFLPRIHETILLVALYHPGSVPNSESRLQALKSQASGGPLAAAAAKRIELLREYYAAAAEGRAQEVAAKLADPSLQENQPAALLARADAALRAGNYRLASGYAQQAIEADPFSPLLALAYVVLGRAEIGMANAPGGALHLQRALAISPLPTLWGKTQDTLAAVYRFARPVPASISGIFEERTVTRVAGAQLKEPQALVAQEGRFLLVDREAVLSVAPEGKVLEAKAAREIKDLAVAPSGKAYTLTEDFIDLGSGAPTRLTHLVGGKAKPLNKMRSVAVDAMGDLYIQDKDAGIFRGSPKAGAALEMTPVSPMRGELLRIDRRGRLFLLTSEQRTVAVLGRDGQQLASISPAVPPGKKPSIEHFALDGIGNLYILDSESASVQIFALRDGGAALETVPIASIPLEQSPAFKNLRVVAVSASGELALAGKNEDSWILYR